MKVLLIARYRDATMQRKVEHLAQARDIELCHILPARWRDDLLDVRQVSAQGRYTQIATPMIGKPSDPHRAFYRTLTFHLPRFRPDIIHAEEEPDSLSALQIAWARRLWAPRARLLLHTWQNLDRPKAAGVRWVMRQTLHAADLIFCANSEAVALLRRYGFTGETPVIPAIGVDTEVFRPCPDESVAPQKVGMQPVYTIAYVGRLVPEKGVDVLLQAVAALGNRNLDRPVHLHLVGDGPLRNELQTLAEQLAIDDRVEFVGPRTPPQIADMLRRFDVVALPSRTTPVWKEQLGRALLEAMACGVPVVGSDSGAIPEVVGDAGLIVPEGDAPALAAALARLLASPELRRELGRRGRARVEVRYSQRHLAEQTLAVYRRVLA
ncbi:MAG: glycosyltransferase [Caldilinea sp.]|nr:glycosyltransferase [Caldilinea sp.]MDW8442014.1 glycosyltransferase [Caldilineaceae bacterium]